MINPSFLIISLILIFFNHENIIVIVDNAFCDPDTDVKCSRGLNIALESSCIEKGCCFKNFAFGVGGCFQPKCIEGCQTCVNSVNCEECRTNYYLTEDTKICLDKIIDNYYLDGNILKKCHSNCLKCSNSKNYNCISCKPNHYLTEDTGSCFNNEIDNYYLDNNILKRCHPNCLKCYNNQNINCISCKSNFYKTEDNNSCQNEAIDNYYLDNNILRRCHPNCLRCSNAENKLHFMPTELLYDRR